MSASLSWMQHEAAPSFSHGAGPADFSGGICVWRRDHGVPRRPRLWGLSLLEHPVTRPCEEPVSGYLSSPSLQLSCRRTYWTRLVYTPSTPPMGRLANCGVPDMTMFVVPACKYLWVAVDADQVCHRQVPLGKHASAGAGWQPRR